MYFQKRYCRKSKSREYINLVAGKTLEALENGPFSFGE